MKKCSQCSAQKHLRYGRELPFPTALTGLSSPAAKALSPIKSMISSGLPVFGTCAGLILLAKKTGDGAVYLDAMDIKAERNAYGRQLGSFRTKAVFDGIGEIEEVFIRAPYISEVWGDAKILSSVDGRIVAARQGKLLVTAFHPELTSDTRVHGCFLDMIRGDR